MLSALQILSLVSIIITGRAQRAVIIPLSYTARLGTVGTFHCATIGEDVISWYVNGTRSTYSIIRNRQISTSAKTPINATWSQSSLTVYASQENDGLSIYCVAVVLGGRDGFSLTATFHVKRQPLPPTNLTLEVSEDHRDLILRWTPPPEMTQIIIYTVYVNISRIGTEFFLNSTMREYTLVNPCSDVLFKVTAWDNIGEGYGTTLLYTHITTDTNSDIIVKTLTASVTFTTSGEPSVQLTFQIQDTKFCFHRIFQNNPQSFLVEMWSDCSDSTLHQGPLMLEPIFLNSTMTLFIPHLHPNCHIIAGVQNHEVLNYSSNVTFSTYDVQDAEISKGSSLLNSICITCNFAQGTSAQGCYILVENHDSVVINITGLRVEREGDSLNVTGCIENLEGGMYHVVVYDIEEDGTIDWHNRALVITAALNWTSPSFEPDQLNTDTPSIFIPTNNLTLQEDNTASVIAGGAGAGGLLLVVTTVILFCILIMRKVHSKSLNIKESNHDDSETIEMKKNEIYGQLPQQQLVRNPAYNWWNPRHIN